MSDILGGALSCEGVLNSGHCFFFFCWDVWWYTEVSSIGCLLQLCLVLVEIVFPIGGTCAIGSDSVDLGSLASLIQ